MAHPTQKGLYLLDRQMFEEIWGKITVNGRPVENPIPDASLFQTNCPEFIRQEQTVLYNEKISAILIDIYNQNEFMKTTVLSLTNVIMNKLVPTIDKMLTAENTLITNQMKMNGFLDRSVVVLGKISEGLERTNRMLGTKFKDPMPVPPRMTIPLINPYPFGRAIEEDPPGIFK